MNGQVKVDRGRMVWYGMTECGACSRSVVQQGVVESVQMRVVKRLFGSKQYSSRSSSAGRSRVEKAGGEEGRVSGGETKRGQSFKEKV